MQDDIKLRIVAARAHGMLTVLAKHGPEEHKQQAREITNAIAELIWPGNPEYKVEADA